LPVAVAGSFASEAPLIAAAFYTDHFFVVSAFPLTSPHDLISRLTSGGKPTHRAKALGEVTELAPLASGSSRSLYVRGRYLVSSEEPEDARFAARYLTSGLALRPVPASTGAVFRLPGRALAGPVRRMLDEAWRSAQGVLTEAERNERARHAGRAADFGDPAAAVAGLGRGVTAVQGVLESTKELDLVLEPGGDRVFIDARLTPEKTGVLSELLADSATGSTASLLEASRAGTALALLRSTRSGREQTGKEIASQLRALFGDRLDASAAALIERTLSHFALGRGDELSLALEMDPAPALLVRCPVADRERLDAAVDGLLEMLRVPALVAPASALVGPIETRPARRLADGGSVLMNVGPPAERRRLKLEWKYERARFELRVGLELAPAPARDREAPGDQAGLRDALRRHSPAEAVLALRLARAAGQGDAGNAATWALLSLGESGAKGVVRAEAPAELLLSVGRHWLVPATGKRP
ncbi:MAG TPA: hypothetical protein VF989_17040, partial [Polyangiaceae bacterium]